MKKYLTGTAGFTYIELLIGMTLTVMLLAAVFGLLSTSLTSWQTGSSRIEAQQTARVGLDAMVRELRYDAVSILTANGQSNNLIFINRNGETVEFFGNGNVLSRRLLVGGAPLPSNPIAGSNNVTVSRLWFTVGDVGATSTSILRNKKSIEINIEATGTNSPAFLLSTTIVPVNT